MTLVHSCSVKWICVLKVHFHTTVGAKLDVLQGDCRVSVACGSIKVDSAAGHSLRTPSWKIHSRVHSPNALNVTCIPHVPEKNYPRSGVPCHHVCYTEELPAMAHIINMTNANPNLHLNFIWGICIRFRLGLYLPLPFFSVSLCVQNRCPGEFHFFSFIISFVSIQIGF